MAYSSTTLPIIQGNIYHIYNHAVGEAKIFSKPFECERFLADIGKRIPRASELYAWCLMSNHFHLLLKVTGEPNAFSAALGDSLNAYAKWYNTRNGRMGGVFVRPFKRKIATDDAYIRWLAWYIHRNPLHHHSGFDWTNYPWSSYKFFAGAAPAPNFLHLNFLPSLFGNLEAMLEYHAIQAAQFSEDELI